MTKINVNNLLKKAMDQVASVGVKHGKINPEVIINTRAKKRFGQCKKVPYSEYDYEVQINAKLLEVEESKIMNTLVHEVLHTCKGCMNHGRLWKNYANIMNNKFNYDISRTSTYEKIGIERPEVNYTIECQKCGNKFYRQNRSKIVTQTDKYRCACGGKLKLI